MSGLAWTLGLAAVLLAWALLAKLGLERRTQAAVFAAKHLHQ